MYNPKLAASQLMGGMIMGIGQASLEEGSIDSSESADREC
ncbi:molybdopterin cofactor-binding domain-containing protein [Pseudomonas sp. P105]|nr:molybdopterin cofactor-binding domain-containing protein [Pseudomonas sp. P105]WNZ81245.1 molybdopterin-dependent oxidoreductase [Pseudomonas sp. P105]